MSTPQHPLHDVFERADAVLAEAARHAGEGLCDAPIERSLRSASRALCALLDAHERALADTAFDAALRVIDSAEPDAPLLMLQLARENLTRAVRRRIAQPWLQRAA